MDQLSSWIVQNLGFSLQVQNNLFRTFLIILVLWITQEVLLRSVVRRIIAQETRYYWKKIIQYLALAIGAILIGQIWFEGMQSITTYLGLLSAGLAIALKETVADIAGWIYILTRKPFTIGDRIQLGNWSGDVIDLSIFDFTLMEIGNWVGAEQSTGRLLHLPNSLVFTSVLANYTKGFHFIWNEIQVALRSDSNWQLAKQLLQQIIEEHVGDLENQVNEHIQNVTERYMLQTGKITPIIYTSVRGSTILLTIRYLCEPRKRRDSTHTIWEKVLISFSQHPEIELAAIPAVPA
jgi:small-conductance mechanosensitive channel